MTMWTEPKVNVIAGLSRQLQGAYDDIQSAKHADDSQALGYAEGKSLCLRREIAKLDPRGYGHQYLGALTESERTEALSR